jgi:hypothetical protein
MIHALLVLAVILFIIWLLFHAVGALIHLLWIAIVAAVVLWVVFAIIRAGSAPLGK